MVLLQKRIERWAFEQKGLFSPKVPSARQERAPEESLHPTVRKTELLQGYKMDIGRTT